MPRPQKEVKLRREMCFRLKFLIEEHLSLDTNKLSERLGYANSTVLRKVWKGETFPDTERLSKLAMIKSPDGRVPNIHWLITGDGYPLIYKEGEPSLLCMKKVEAILGQMPEAKIEHLLEFLSR